MYAIKKERFTGADNRTNEVYIPVFIPPFNQSEVSNENQQLQAESSGGYISNAVNDTQPKINEPVAKALQPVNMKAETPIEKQIEKPVSNDNLIIGTIIMAAIIAVYWIYMAYRK